ncbi:MAG TPA: ABC transporter substrate-binding protein [Candidatus Binatia bacterium]|jgi:phospholipid transport system substrate-binding protein
MRIYKFNSENWDDLQNAVAEEVSAPEEKLSIRSDHFEQCLVGGRKRVEDPKKETTHRARNGLWHHGWSVIALVLIFLARAAIAGASPATDQLKQSVEKAQAILADKSLKGPAKTNERRQQLRDVINSRFDFEEMAKRSLGPEWQKHSPEEQQQFVSAFQGVLENGYFETLESYNGEKVRFVGERQDSDIAEVQTKITDNKGQDYSVNYRLHNVNGDWKVFDVVVENVSIVNNYRSQFNRVLAKSSFQNLLQEMNQKKFAAVTTKG